MPQAENEGLNNSILYCYKNNADIHFSEDLHCWFYQLENETMNYHPPALSEDDFALMFHSSPGQPYID